MRKLVFVSTLAAAIGPLGVAAALAGGGGMGDPSTHIREMNAICEKQRHGEGPLSPNLCLPEYPPGVQYQGQHGRGY